MSRARGHWFGVNLTAGIIRNEIFLCPEELVKGALNKGIRPEIYFFRDSHGNEVDLLIREKGELTLVEIKSAGTFSMDFVKGLERFQALGLTCNCRYGPLWRRTTIHCPWRPHSQSAPYRRYLGDPDYSGVTDGIIVGSAIIKLIEAHTIKQGNDLKAGPGLVKKVGEFIGQLKEATKTGY